MTWETAAELYVENARQTMRPLSLRNFRSCLRRFLRAVPIERPADLQTRHLWEYLAFLQRTGKTSTTISSSLTTLYSFIRWAVRERVLFADPLQYFELPRLPRTHRRVLSYPEVCRILDLEPLSLIEQRNLAMAELLYGTGLRCQEMIDLELADLDCLQRQLLVRCGKGGKSRWIPFGPAVAQILRHYLENTRPRLCQRETRALWLSVLGQPLSSQTWSGGFRQLCHRAGLPWVTSHALRHAYATHLLEGGAELIHVQLLLGHATMASTQIYTHLVPQEMLREYRRTHPRARRRSLAKSN